MYYLAYGIIVEQVTQYLGIFVTQKRMMEVICEARNVSEEVSNKWNNIRDYFINTITQDITYSKNYNLIRNEVNPEIAARSWYAVNDAFQYEVLSSTNKYGITALAKHMANMYVHGIYNISPDYILD